MNLLYFDIETAAKYKDFKSFQNDDPRGASIFEKKVEKFRYEMNVDEAYLNKAPLFFEYNVIVCLTYGYHDSINGFRVKSLIGDEKQILIDSNKILKNFIKNEYLLCGYNIKRFDIPLLNIKHYQHSVPMHRMLDLKDKKPWDINHKDIFEIWNKGYNNFASLDEVCYVLNIDSPKDKISGKDVHNEYHKGNINRIVEYCEKDVKVLPKIIDKLYFKI